MKSTRFVAALDQRTGLLRCVVATLLAAILVLQTAPVASGSALPKTAAVEPSAHEAKLKQKVVKIHPQSMVRVKLKNNEKLRGRLTQVTDQNFTVKILQGQDFVDRQLAYSQVKYVRSEESGGSQAKHWLIVGVVVGVIFGVLAILGAKYSNS